MKAVRLSRQMEARRLAKLETNSMESRSKQIGPVGQGDTKEVGESSSAVISWGSEEAEGELSPEEEQLLEQENMVLLDQLNSLTNQVDTVAAKVVKVAEL